MRIGRPIEEDDVTAIWRRMREIVDADIPFHRIQSPTEDAIEMFRRQGMTSKVRLLESYYKAKIDSMMYRVVGTAEMSMDKGAPESLLSNLVADVLRGAAAQVLGKPADMGLVNMGGLRNVLTEGAVTCGNIYEILPFENSLCVVTLKGVYLNHLFENIAARGGEGVSGVQLQITKDGKLLRAAVAGKPVVDDKLYTVATIDYLADGNDGMTALIQGEKRDCPPVDTPENADSVCRSLIE